MTKINPSQIDGTPIEELPLSKLIQPAEDILAASGLSTLLQRLVYTEKEKSFFLEFSNIMPSGEIRPLFPDFKKEKLLKSSWKKIFVEIILTNQGVRFNLKGHYFKSPVPIDLDFTILQGQKEYKEDSIKIFDRRIEKTYQTSFKEIMETKMKTGDLKYTKATEVYGELTIQKIIKIFNRFLKDWTLKHRIIERN
ncbi:MAG: hypothetical protein PF689_02910 [Deltaproteobacteria bacterium]|jgi:hypothetical protein|nr:hypothetical protein [Deltaproteobacteria bacterium]